MVINAINSVLEQTYFALECIIVDDGSTDNTEESISQIKDDRLRYIKLARNSGPAAARNVGIKESRGNYIAFHDSDDIWFPDKLRLQMEKINCEEEIGMVYCGYSYQKNGKEMKIPSERNKPFQLEGHIFDSLWQDNKIGTPTILIKKKCIQVCGGFVEGLHSLEDWEFVLRISAKYKIAYVNKVLVRANYSPQGVNGQHELQAETVWQIIKSHQKKWGDMHMVSLLFQKLAFILNNDIISCWENRLVPLLIASKADFVLALTLAKEKNRFQRVNKVYAKISNLEILRSFLNQNVKLEKERIAIYGAGDLGICLARNMKLLNIPFDFIIDNNDVYVEGFNIVKPCMERDRLYKVIVTIMDAADEETVLELPDYMKIINLFDIIDW